MKKISIAASYALLLMVLGIFLASCSKASSAEKGKSDYDFATIARGNIESTVTSSGTLAAVSTVSILSEMSGRVEKVYADYNDKVKTGQVLVALNTDMLRLQAKEDEAAVSKARANYDLQKVDFENKSKLLEKGLVSDYDYKSSKASLDVCAAELSSAQSSLSIDNMKINQYALITSPIDGIVLDKNVDVGQSVVEGSSSNAASLYTLAENLSSMQIKAEVDELDISSIHKGQDVRFTVEAQPGLNFTGKVDEIRLVPQTSNNVVTYYVIIDAENKDGKLLPGMTAEVQFIKEKKTDVLVVPSAVFRFSPPDLSSAEIEDLKLQAVLATLPADQRAAVIQRIKEQKEAAQAASSNGTTTQAKGLAGLMMPTGRGFGGPPGPEAKSSGTNGGMVRPAQVKKALWYVDPSGKLAVRMVDVGASDGLNTEILGADDMEGKQIIQKVRVE